MKEISRTFQCYQCKNTGYPTFERKKGETFKTNLLKDNIRNVMTRFKLLTSPYSYTITFSAVFKKAKIQDESHEMLIVEMTLFFQ